MGAQNGVLSTEILVVGKNVASWLLINPLLGPRRVGLFVSQLDSWSINERGREASIEIIGFSTLRGAELHIASHTRKKQICLQHRYSDDL